jgi:hypothetical protein
MPKKIDLIGQVFGRLTVIEDAGKNKHNNVIWKCLCDCGNMTNVTTGHLQNGDTQSCGCLHKERITANRKVDLTGRRFGRLTVLTDDGRTPQSTVIWRCICECGNIVNVRSRSLLRGNTQSCGCYMRDRITETNKKDLVGQVYGRLTVLEDIGRKNHEVLWRCLCECGTIINLVTGRLQSGKTQSCGCYKREQQSGKNHYNWKGGITPLREGVRKCIRYKEWRITILKRDNFTCGHCNVRGGKLHAHHTTHFSKIMKENNITTLEEAEACEALWDVNNGITLCKKCHKKEHRRLKGLTI